MTQFWLFRMGYKKFGKRGLSWFKVKEVASGVSFYKPALVNDQLVWKWQGVNKEHPMDFYENKYAFLDYTPGVHDPMIVSEIKQGRSY